MTAHLLKFAPQANTAKILLVGEMNPYGAHPKFALYPEPRNASGDRLRKILDLTDEEYLARYDRVNLCSGRWRLTDAREAAVHLRLRRDLRDHSFVLLGEKVRQAFRLKLGFFDVDDTSFVEGRAVLCLPHPSGLNRSWDLIPTWKKAARGAMRKLERGR